MYFISNNNNYCNFMFVCFFFRVDKTFSKARSLWWVYILPLFSGKLSCCICWSLITLPVFYWNKLQACCSLEGCSMSLPQTGIVCFECVNQSTKWSLSKMNEPVKGRADGQQWGSWYPVCAAISAVLAGSGAALSSTWRQAGSWACIPRATADRPPHLGML